MYDFIRNEVGFEANKILIFGRSIGSGPATYLAAKREIGMLTLLSPFNNIKGLVKHIGGSIASFFISDHFNNL